MCHLKLQCQPTMLCRMTDMESHNPASEIYPSYGVAGPAGPAYPPPPPYMPPPYPTGPVTYPQPIPAQVGFIVPDLPPEEAGFKTEEDPNSVVTGAALLLKIKLSNFATVKDFDLLITKYFTGNNNVFFGVL